MAPLGSQQDKLYYSYNYQEIYASIIQSLHMILNTEVLVQQWNWRLQLLAIYRCINYLVTMELLKVCYWFRKHYSLAMKEYLFTFHIINYTSMDL